MKQRVFLGQHSICSPFGGTDNTIDSLLSGRSAIRTETFFDKPVAIAPFSDTRYRELDFAVGSMAKEVVLSNYDQDSMLFIYCAAKGDIRALGIDGLTPLSTFDSKLRNTPLCAQITFEHDYFKRYYRTLALALIAVDEALSEMPDRHGLRTGVVAATTVGGIPQTERIYEKIRQHDKELPALVPQVAIHEPTVLSARVCEHGEGFGSPRNFIASVHNSMAGKLALDFSISGPNLTVCDGHNSMASALSVASLLQEHELPALLLLIDEHIPLLDQITPHLSPPCTPFIHAQWKEAAVAFIIDRKESGTPARIRGFGPVITTGKHPEEQCKNLAAESVDMWQQCDFVFKKSTTSFIQPVLEIKHLITTGKAGRTLVGSYSPSSKGCAIIEYTYA